MKLPFRVRTLVACAMLANLVVAAAPSFAQSSAPPVSKATTLDQEYASFGFDTLRELRTQGSGTNVFISPTSIAIALSMVANGARGATQTAILKTLAAPDRTIDTLNAQNRTLIAQLAKSQAVQLTLADALWLQQGFPVRPAFQKTLKTFYGASAENIDFRNAAAPGTINAWAAKNTNDRVKKIVERIDPTTILMLTNAIAFKAKWTDPFSARETSPEDFTDAAGAKHSVQMMQRTGEYAYAKTGDAEAIRLPYADESFAMYVVLPADDQAMQRFVHDLTPDTFATLRSSLTSGRGTIELPKFTMNYGTSLNEALKNLGMSIAYESGADFGGIHAPPPPIAISEVRHASFLKVDEEGTEAAAVTSVGMIAMAMPPMALKFHMVVNRPFFVAIRDEKSGQLLFMGTIANPQS